MAPNKIQQFPCKMLAKLPQFQIILFFIFHHFASCLPISIQPDNIFTLNGQPGLPMAFFRQMLLNQKLSSLYVGSKGNLFRLWLFNINDTSSATLFSRRQFSIPPEEREECLRLGNSEHECAFWVRQIFQRGDGSLLLCSSQAMKPQLGPVDGQTLQELGESRTQIGICSQHEALNTTAVYTESGNPEGLAAIYSGIATGQTLENHLIYRPPLMAADGSGKEAHPALRTSIYDNTWLNEPQFVGSFSLGPHIFFFFRELLAADCFNCPGGTSTGAMGKGNWVSRVARICKSDLGGRQVLRQVWTSFVKARLNCSLPGFSFDQIQGVSRVDWPEEDGLGAGGGTHFYATFSAAEHTLFQATAICAFSLAKINQLFDMGLFLEQAASGTGSWWNPIPADQVPQSHRPGSCQPDSRELGDEALHFAKSHLLMAEPIGGLPILQMASGHLFTQIVADSPIKMDGAKMEGGRQKVLLFAYSPSQNSLVKVLHENGQSRAHLLAIYRLPPEFVHSMAILPGEYFYLATDSKVSQFRLGQCPSYGDDCGQCVRDPHCSWSIPRGECFPAESAHSSAVGWLAGGNPEEAAKRCKKWTKTREIRIFPGDSLHLECPGAKFEGARVQWTHNGQIVPPENSEHLIHAKGGGIVLLNVTEGEQGQWKCGGEGEMEAVEYSLQLDGEDCAKPKSVDQFHAVQREWCRRMDAYRSNLSKWQSLYEGGGNCPDEKQQNDQQQQSNNIR